MGDLLTEKNWLTINESCEYLGVSKPTLYSYMKDEILPYYYLPGKQVRRIKREDLDALLIRGKPEELLQTESSNDEDKGAVEN